MLNPVMNDTKWDELRLAMHALTFGPAWSSLSTNGFQSPRDRDWFYHFYAGGYEDIIHVDIFVEHDAMRDGVRAALKLINVPGEETDEGFRVFGYLRDGQAADYI
jgi:hypothetical protein